MQCLNCKIGLMQPPPNNHPSYIECTHCRAIELTYVPQDYQEGIHEVDYTYTYNDELQRWDIDTQIVGAFGGKNSVAAVKRAKFRETLRATA